MEIPNVNNLLREKDNKEKAKNDVFTLVLNKCIEKIIYTNRNTDKTFIFFEVPKILIGFPYYDISACVIFLIQKLSEANYKVHFIEPFYLYIDWASPIKTNKDNDIILNLDIDDDASKKLKSQTKELLKKFPNTSKIVFQYEDENKKSNKKKNKKIK